MKFICKYESVLIKRLFFTTTFFENYCTFFFSAERKKKYRFFDLLTYILEKEKKSGHSAEKKSMGVWDMSLLLLLYKKC